MLLASILLRRDQSISGGLCNEDELKSGNNAETAFIDLNDNLSRVSSDYDINSHNYAQEPWNFDETTSSEATPEPSSVHETNDETSWETSNDNINNGVENPVSTAGVDDETAAASHSDNNEVSTEQSDSNQPAGSNADQGLEVGRECMARTPYVGTEECTSEACLQLCGAEYSVAICDFWNNPNLGGVFCCCDPIPIHT